ncbi:hypothetical protein [Capnocytophaga cynodegmi]|nr:hypothetical protein [Capnocytophaga cynodegmi]
MKKFYIFIGVLLLVVGIYDLWYKGYAQEQRFFKIVEKSQNIEETQEIKKSIQTKIFKDSHLKYVMRKLYEYCDTEVIKFDFYTVIFNASRKSCIAIYKVDLLDLECKAYNSEYIGIEFYMAKLLKRDNIWQIEKIESDGYIYDAFVTLGEIPKQVIFSDNEEMQNFTILSKEEKRNYIKRIPVEKFYNILWEISKQELGYNFVDERYWFDEK